VIIYSVTISIDANVRADWLGWMEQTHIPDVMRTGCFASYVLQEVTDPPPQTGSYTFNVQYACESVVQYQDYLNKYAPALQADHGTRYKDKFVAFRTLLKRLASGKTDSFSHD